MNWKSARVKEGLKIWLISALLVLPALFPYYTHYFVKTDGLIPSGFIQFDQPFYMGNAREHFDNGSFRLTYSNPASPYYDSPAIYFQPQTLFWGALWRLSGWNPGFIFVATGLIAGVVCMRMALAVYKAVVGLDTPPEWFGLVIFCWGGGLLALAGIFFNLITQQFEHSIFRFDPFDGWWFLNLGRNLIFPSEAIYHAFFLGSVFCVIKKKLGLALLLAFVLSFSHPYTGIELLGILTAWAFLEVVLLRNREVPVSFLICLVVLSGLHLGYYLGFLKQFPEHRSLQSQTELPWILSIKNILPAYSLVGGFALWSIFRRPGVKIFLRSPLNRLLLTWFFVAFLLANHELFMRPIQPLHFTRGYIWMPLFLLGARSLTDLFARLALRKQSILKFASISLLVVVFLADNALWLGSFPSKGWYGFRLTHDERELYSWFAAPENKRALVVSEDNRIGYFSTVYSPLRAWCSHYSNTPEFNQRQEEVRQFFRGAPPLAEWQRVTLLIVSPSSKPFNRAFMTAGNVEITTPFHNSSFTVVRVKPKEIF